MLCRRACCSCTYSGRGFSRLTPVIMTTCLPAKWRGTQGVHSVVLLPTRPVVLAAGRVGAGSRPGSPSRGVPAALTDAEAGAARCDRGLGPRCHGAVRGDLVRVDRESTASLTANREVLVDGGKPSSGSPRAAATTPPAPLGCTRSSTAARQPRASIPGPSCALETRPPAAIVEHLDATGRSGAAHRSGR